MSSCTPEGMHMSEDILNDALKFIMENQLQFQVIVSGGEPTEHPEFMKFMNKIIETLSWTSYPHMITITSNGFWCLEHPEEAKSLVRDTPYLKVNWQISTDARYYPQQLPTHKKLWREPGFILCTNCVDHMYPQGRALMNNLDWQAKSSKCFNIRAISKQLEDPLLKGIVLTLYKNMKFCIPAIRIDGTISLGESDHCPKMASIYDDPTEIVRRIQMFECHQCDHINKNLPDFYKIFL